MGKMSLTFWVAFSHGLAGCVERGGDVAYLTLSSIVSIQRDWWNTSWIKRWVRNCWAGSRDICSCAWWGGVEQAEPSLSQELYGKRRRGSRHEPTMQEIQIQGKEKAFHYEGAQIVAEAQRGCGILSLGPVQLTVAEAALKTSLPTWVPVLLIHSKEDWAFPANLQWCKGTKRSTISF